MTNLKRKNDEFKGKNLLFDLHGVVERGHGHGELVDLALESAVRLEAVGGVHFLRARATLVQQLELAAAERVQNTLHHLEDICTLFISTNSLNRRVMSHTFMKAETR